MIVVKHKPKMETKMRMAKMIAALISDERGGEVAEYAIVAGLITVASLGVIGKFGTKVLARWGSLNSSM
jgi:Flp pilus assembly pilin Flp